MANNSYQNPGSINSNETAQKKNREIICPVAISDYHYNLHTSFEKQKEQEINLKFTSCDLELGNLFPKDNNNAKGMCLPIPYIQNRLLIEIFVYPILDRATNYCFASSHLSPPALIL